MGWLYGRATARRVGRAPDVVPAVPVISIGNINAGGTGKTPVTIALAEWARDAGLTARAVTRGYGGAAEGPMEVDPRQHGAEEVGDEPLLLAAFVPTVVAKDRAAGVRLAETGKPDLILLDDAHQNPSVAKRLSLVVVDAVVGFGNGLCVPAGPLREPITVGLARADALIVVGEPEARRAFHERYEAVLPQALPVLEGALEPLQTGMAWDLLNLYAFAGIGHPEKFFATLRRLGAKLVGTQALADHQELTEPLLARLARDAAEAKAQLVTTEKDAVRLPESYRAKVLTLPVRFRFADPKVADGLLKSALTQT